MKVAQQLRRTVALAVLAITASMMVAGWSHAGPAASPRFSFGVVADVQYADAAPSGVRYYRNSTAKLSQAIETFNARNLAFVVQLGDLIDRNLASFVDILPMYYRSKAPTYHVLGNHDFAAPTPYVVQLLRMPRAFYDFEFGGWRFVVLDTNDVSTYANPLDPATQARAEDVLGILKGTGAVNAQTWNGAVSGAQLDWLKGVLDSAEKAGQRVVVMGHMPLYPENEHNVWNDEQVMETLEGSKAVAAYFNGHNHAGNYGERNGVYYVNFRGMVDTPNENAYAVVHVFDDRLEIEGFGREPDRTLTLMSQVAVAAAR